jgi:hypothetical protein
LPPGEGRFPPFDHLGLGIRYHLQVTTSVLAVVMAALAVGRTVDGRNEEPSALGNAEVARRTRAGRGCLRLARFGWHLTVQSGVEPALTATAILVVPVVVLLAAAWTQWVASDREAAGGLAAPEPR